MFTNRYGPVPPVKNCHAKEKMAMYAVAVIKELRGRETVVGHLPRQISMVCHSFLRKMRCNSLPCY